MDLNEAKGKPWKFGKKHDIRGTVAAALKHHPDKFSTTDSDKMNPYAIFTAKEKETKGGIESHYKDQPTTSKKAPKKKAEFKDEDKKEDKKEESSSLWGMWKRLRESAGTCKCQCSGCRNGECASCSCEECACEGCGCKS